MGIYDDVDTSASLNLIIPNQKTNMDKKTYKILDVFMKEGRSQDFPVMKLEDVKTTKQFLITAWGRDVKPLIKDWGTNEQDWKNRYIELKIEDGRMFVEQSTYTPEEKVEA